MESLELKQFAVPVSNFERQTNWMSNLVRLADWMSNIEISHFLRRLASRTHEPWLPVCGGWCPKGGYGSRREGGDYGSSGSHYNFDGNWRTTSNSVLSYQMVLFFLARWRPGSWGCYVGEWWFAECPLARVRVVFSFFMSLQVYR